MRFKKVYLIVLILTAIVFSCEKENDDFQSNGVITGPDPRDCICCGGYFVEIDDSIYNFNTLPTSSDIDLAAETFPLEVKLDWTHENKCGDIQYIDILRIAKE